MAHEAGSKTLEKRSPSARSTVHTPAPTTCIHTRLHIDITSINSHTPTIRDLLSRALQFDRSGWVPGRHFADLCSIRVSAIHSTLWRSDISRPARCSLDLPTTSSLRLIRVSHRADDVEDLPRRVQSPRPLAATRRAVDHGLRLSSSGLLLRRVSTDGVYLTTTLLLLLFPHP